MRVLSFWRVSSCLFVVISLIAGAQSGAAQDFELSGTFGAAYTAYDEGRYAPAIIGFTAVIENDNSLTAGSLGLVYWLRGTAYQAVGDEELALVDFTQAIEIMPALARAYYSRGLLYRSLGDAQAAIADFDRAIAYSGNSDDDVFADRALSYFNLAHYDPAVESYTQAIRISPDQAGYHNLRGAAYLILEEYGSAISDFDVAIRLDPNIASAYLNRAIAYSKIENLAQVIADFNEALRLNPDLDGASELRLVSQRQADYAARQAATGNAIEE